MNAQCPHKRWSTLKSAVFGSSSDSSLPPLTGAGGGICCADMLSAHFDGKQSRDPVDLPSTCHPSPSLTTFAFGSREVKRLLLDLDSYDGTDPLGMFHVFLKKTAEVLAPRLTVVFRRFLRLGSFPVCWRVANVTPIPKGPPSSSASNYRPIYFLNTNTVKGFERLPWCRLFLGEPTPTNFPTICPTNFPEILKISSKRTYVFVLSKKIYNLRSYNIIER